LKMRLPDRNGEAVSGSGLVLYRFGISVQEQYTNEH